MSGFRRIVNDICAGLGFYAAHIGGSLPTLRANLSVPFSMVKMGPIGLREPFVGNYNFALHIIEKERRSHL